LTLAITQKILELYSVRSPSIEAVALRAELTQVMYSLVKTSTISMIITDPAIGLRKVQEEAKNLSPHQVNMFWIACSKLFSEKTVVDLRNENQEQLFHDLTALMIYEKYNHEKKFTQKRNSRTFVESFVSEVLYDTAGIAFEAETAGSIVAGSAAVTTAAEAGMCGTMLVSLPFAGLVIGVSSGLGVLGYGAAIALRSSDIAE